tara:strand:- start:3138 stop:3275 length:138 start_codon:yes stop_codon:yes gene_type:complete
MGGGFIEVGIPVNITEDREAGTSINYNRYDLGMIKKMKNIQINFQ